MLRMFGERACANIIDGVCTLTPPAQEWMQKMNNAMNGGHCEGMAVLSELMYYGEIDPGQFGATNVFDLQLDGNPDLQREIAYWWVTQATYPGSSIKVSGAPSVVVQTLQETFLQGRDLSEAWAVGIYMPDKSGGHSITPVAVDNQGQGIYHIQVYDNNFPGETRTIIVDTDQETWRYNGSTNPSETTRLYEGDQQTQTLEIVAISPRMELQECTFCEGGDQSWFRGSALDEVSVDQEYFEIWLEGEANLLIVDHEDRQVGFVEGEFVNEIPTASTHWMRLGPEAGDDFLDPIYRIPQGPAFEFFIDGTNLESETSSGLSVIATGYFISIDGILLEPGTKEQVSMWLRDDGQGQIIYWPDDFDTPTVLAGYETAGADYVYRARAVSLESEEDELDVRVNPQTGEFILNTEFNEGTSIYDISVQRYDEQGTRTFYLVELPVPPNAQVIIHYDLDQEGFFAYADFGVNGTIDETYEIIYSIDPFEWN